MKLTHTFPVKSLAQLARIEAEWRTTLSTGETNSAVSITRTADTLTVHTETGATLTFSLRSN